MMNWAELFGSRSPHHIRRRADKARDRHSWAKAAVLYAEYLDRYPDDFSILVQLGHMRKEAGDLDGALASYRSAHRLQPEDADLLLNLGHLYKVRGEISQAYEHYVMSALRGDGGFATTEAHRLRLEYSDIVYSAPPPEVGARQNISQAAQAVIALLLPISIGVEVIDVNAIECDPLNALSGTACDPWILLRPDAMFTDVRIAELQLMVVGETFSDRPLAGRLYIDYGDGFAESRVVHIPEVTGPITVLLALPSLIKHLRWDPDDRKSRFKVAGIALRGLSKQDEIERSLDALGIDDLQRKLALRAVDLLNNTTVDAETAEAIQRQMSPTIDVSQNYLFWLECYVNPASKDYDRMASMIDRMRIRPRFSFIIPTYNTPPELLRECLDSMLGQTYQNFEICVADDSSSDPRVADVLAEYAARDPRIRFVVRTKNGHISAASNSALALATGDFAVLVDHDDLIPDYALLVVAHYINLHPDADIFFSDEDKLDQEGNRNSPYFKADFSKFLMFGHNMISHLGVYRRSLLEQIGGFRLGLEGSQDYDLFLRSYERCGDLGVVHIPHVLYHWRAIPGSTAVSADQKSYAIVAAEAAISGYMERADMPIRSTGGLAPGLTAVMIEKQIRTSVSIVIPTRDGLDVLEPCIGSILRGHPDNVEIVIVNNGSRERATKRYLFKLERLYDGIKVISYDQPFNFSDVCNFGARHASGEILCFLNNDTEVLKDGWINRARALLSLDDVGIVGARLIFPDGTLQHFGITLGMGAHRVAGTPHQGIPREQFGYFGKGALIQDFSAVSGACLFTRARNFHDLGGFDPRLRIAYNDVDLCLRYRRAGLRVLCDPDIELFHKESRSRGDDTSPEKAARLEVEAQLMRQRWALTLDSDPFWSPNHALDRSDMALAYPPRAPMPWRIDG